MLQFGAVLSVQVVPVGPADVLQHVVVSCSLFQCISVCCNVLQCVALCYSVLHCGAVASAQVAQVCLVDVL